MLHRHDDTGLTVISQPAHAWISGQLAAAWGNEVLGLAAAGPELRLAAEQHDIAWLAWERSPTLNSASGLPYAFNQLPTFDHLALWSNAIPLALAYGRLPAMIISMHGTYLYRRFHDFEADASDEAAAAHAFLQSEERAQTGLLRSLEATGDISQKEVQHQRKLLSLWDAMSLALCMGFTGSRTFDGVPTSDGELALIVEALDVAGARYRVDPWPFAGQDLLLQCEGRRLAQTFYDEVAMRAALDAAEPVRLRFALEPARLLD